MATTRALTGSFEPVPRLRREENADADLGLGELVEAREAIELATGAGVRRLVRRLHDGVVNLRRPRRKLHADAFRLLDELFSVATNALSFSCASRSSSVISFRRRRCRASAFRNGAI